jgi:hypothetical protein
MTPTSGKPSTLSSNKVSDTIIFRPQSAVFNERLSVYSINDIPCSYSLCLSPYTDYSKLDTFENDDRATFINILTAVATQEHTIFPPNEVDGFQVVRSTADYGNVFMSQIGSHVSGKSITFTFYNSVPDTFHFFCTAAFYTPYTISLIE